jgi:hypothetical protein
MHANPCPGGTCSCSADGWRVNGQYHVTEGGTAKCVKRLACQRQQLAVALGAEAYSGFDVWLEKVGEFIECYSGLRRLCVMTVTCDEHFARGSVSLHKQTIAELRLLDCDQV